MSSYSAYGLNVQSELPLPEFTRLSVGKACMDVRVSFATELDDPENGWIAAVRGDSSYWHVDAGDSRFWFPGVGAFRVRNGSDIVINPEPGIDNDLLRMYVEGMMMATLLHQRGFFVLHASVVRIGRTCAAFLGHVGAGKSSTAAALHARGHAVVTDDNAAIDLAAPGHPLVTPAFPYVKMFPAIAVSLGYAPASLRQMHSSQPKFTGAVDALFPERPVPLSRIYVLTRDPAVSGIVSLSAGEAVIELVRNSVPTRWKLPGGADHLRRCATLAGRVPLFRVRTFDRLDELPLLAQSIESHV